MGKANSMIIGTRIVPVVKAEQKTESACVAACIAAVIKWQYKADADAAQQALIDELDLYEAGTDFPRAADATKRLGWEVDCHPATGMAFFDLLSPNQNTTAVIAVENSIYYGPGYSGLHAVVILASSGPLENGQDDFVLQAQRMAWRDELGSTVVAEIVTMDPAKGVPGFRRVPQDKLERAYVAAGSQALLLCAP